VTSGQRFGLHVVGWCQVYVETSVRWSSRGTAQLSFKLDTSCATAVRNQCPQCNGWGNVCAGNVRVGRRGNAWRCLVRISICVYCSGIVWYCVSISI
jgi:hypothetical protein